MISTGVKTIESDKTVTNNYVDDHLRIGLDSLKELMEEGHSVKHLRF
jgi:AMP nucleosidase